MHYKLCIKTLLLLVSLNAHAQMKTWWFFGYEKTTNEGITADIKALKDAGFSGVVYYDQNHAKDARANGAEDGFSTPWWRHLRFAAEEARRSGMSFEINISSGYVAGGTWIDADHAMKRVVSADTIISEKDMHRFALPRITGRDNYVRDIAVLAIPYNDDGIMRHFTAQYPAKGKGRNGAMQIPGESDTFMGAKFETMPDIGTLQVSDDSISWRDVLTLENMYSSQGGYYIRTNAFTPTKGKYWRVDYTGPLRLKSWTIGTEALIDRWEEKAALQSDFINYLPVSDYQNDNVTDPSDIIDITDSVTPDGFIEWQIPDNLLTSGDGKWRIIRFAYVLTGAKTKHGRQNLMGYECDKLSTEAAELHWNSYAQVIIDSLNANGQRLIEGVTMDSHEGGSQNWTPLMPQEFKQRRGYDLMPYLPVLAGYVVESRAKTEQVLRDLRLTISDCMRDNYYAAFQRMVTANGLHFTAQAIGNALCITGDAITTKKVVEKPQGEFWTYQQTGAYDVKDCSSAAHLYGRKIASAEAMTDAEYKDSPLDLKRVADIAFSMGAQEFVVCATPHIPETNATNYVAGREYAINRSNRQWDDFKPVWREINRTMTVLRKGKPAPDVLIFLGDDVPVKTLTHRLPKSIDELDWDVCTGDALQHRISSTKDGLLTTPDSITYSALIIEHGVYISTESQKKIDELRSAGVRILSDGSSVIRPLQITKGQSSVVHTHRKIDGKDVFFIANITTAPVTLNYRFAGNPKVRKLTLPPGKSCFVSKK